MHTSILAYLMALPDSELHRALEATSEEEIESLRVYLGLYEDSLALEEAHAGLTQFPSLVEDAIRLGQRVDMYL